MWLHSKRGHLVSERRYGHQEAKTTWWGDWLCEEGALTVGQLALLAEVSTVLHLLRLLPLALLPPLPLLPAPNDAALVERLQAKDPPPVYCHAEI